MTPEVGGYSIVAIALTLCGEMIAVGGLGWISWRMTTRLRRVSSPYGHSPMRLVTTLPYATIGKIYLFCTGLRSFDNRMFDIHRAAYCPDTSRIFPDCVDLFGKISIDWGFLQRRHRGNWASWGSLPKNLQREVMLRHASMKGFQTEFSSSKPSPRHAEALYLQASPGPLYVDLDSGCLLGWQCVTGT
ncbi:MAG: hypothetical protein KDK40_04090, partial [Chlamydiia bacterium]|nr:hypothetical protein [Chlamydiia bacterium]